MMIKCPCSKEEKERWTMNALLRIFLLIALSGLITGCVTSPYDTGYVVPADPVYYNSSPAYYATPVSGYSTMTIYDGYHPRYGGTRYKHRPHGHRDHAYEGRHHANGGHGGRYDRGSSHSGSGVTSNRQTRPQPSGRVSPSTVNRPSRPAPSNANRPSRPAPGRNNRTGKVRK